VFIAVLGPQRRPTLDTVVRDLGLAGPIAMITAGWQEREADDGELMSLLGGRGINLGLHTRWQDVLDRDREFAIAELEHRAVLDELQQLYLGQLDHALGALYAVANRTGGRPRTTDAALEDALAVVRLVDQNHSGRVRTAHADFYGAWRPQDRPLVAEHREKVQRTLELTHSVVVAGGHVGVLVRCLHLFHVAPHLPAVVVAWSAGAMALTDRVVLFHDRVPQGPSHAEIYDDGLGLVHDVVLLPHARRRLLIEDRIRMSVLARRFAPARCVVLDDGVRYDLAPDSDLPPDIRVLAEDGQISTLAPV
jgi:hypothetical protein